MTFVYRLPLATMEMSLLGDKGENGQRTEVAGTKVAAEEQKKLSEFWIIFEVRANGSNELNT